MNPPPPVKTDEPVAPPHPHSTPMDAGSVRFLVIYLLLATILCGYLLYALSLAEPLKDATPLPPAPCAAGGVGLKGILPDRVNAGAPVDVWLVGCGFTDKMAVKFNATQHAQLFVDSSHIRVSLTAAEIATPGNAVFTVWNGTSEVGSGSLSVATPALSWSVFGFPVRQLTGDVQLMLMVVLIGAIGACVYSLKSISDYRGDDKLYKSWFTYYIIQPVKGAGVAFLFNFVLRGGLVTGVDGKASDHYGVFALAGLAGAFADMAFLKLREVFMAAFKPQDDRTGKMGPKISTLKLPTAVIGKSYKATLEAGGGAGTFKWTVNPALPDGLMLDASTGVISGTPTAVSDKEYRFTLTDAASATTNVDLRLSVIAMPPDPKITTATLADATTGTSYTAALAVTGGTGNFVWSVTPALPKALVLNEKTGQIDGVPAAAGTAQPFTFRVTDSTTDQTATQVLSLTIK